MNQFTMETVAKKYKVLKELGQGAMGDVYLVMPPRGEPVALKLLKTLDEKSSQNAIEQFENEFKTLKRLSHPNVGQIYDYGYDENLKKVFFTSPWLKGGDIFESTRGLDFEKCENLFVQVLRALNYLHQKNVIHCDLKPGNIYVEDDKAILIDFGLAGYMDELVVGTPTYLAPEIYQGKKHDVASDLYAIGVVFYNCLTGTQPFSGKSLKEVYNRHRTLTPPPITDINIKVPKYFSDIVLTLLNKKPEERFPSAKAVIEEIDAFSKESYSVETEETLLSYLPTDSELIGRKEAIKAINQAVHDYTSDDQEYPFHLVLVNGQKNIGKSKVTKKLKEELQLSKILTDDINLPLAEGEEETILKSKAVVLENLSEYLAQKDSKLDEALRIIEQKVLSPDSSHFIFIVSAEKPQDFTEITKLFPVESTKITQIELIPYTHDETEEFLETVIGSMEIPEKFVDQFHRNTAGLPGLAHELIQSMIADGLLFDKSGRWNEDLLIDLEKAFDKHQASESIEQEFEKLYNTFTPDEEEVVIWLSLCPHPLNYAQLKKLSGNEGIQSAIFSLHRKKIIRVEEKSYLLRQIFFRKFVEENLPEKSVKAKHTRLAKKDINLDKKWASYHLSRGTDPELAKKAGENLAKIFIHEGERDEAAKIYMSLYNTHLHESPNTKLEWVVQASTLYIWLDQFQNAIDLISDFEKEIREKKLKVSEKTLLTLIEKKGLALLHTQQLQQVFQHFKSGLRFSSKSTEYEVQKLRFENDLALIEMVKGHHERAIQTFEKTRSEAKSLPQKEQETITNNDLGHVHLQLGQPEKSLQTLSEDIQMFSKMINQEPLARALYSYAQNLESLKDTDNAIQAYKECITLCRHGHFLPLLMRSYNGLGNLYISINKHDEALDSYQKALELSVRLADATSKSALLFNQGYIYLEKGNTSLAKRRFHLAIQVLENKKTKIAYDQNLLDRCYNSLASLSLDNNNLMKALSYTIERKKLAIQSNAKPAELFELCLELADMYLKNRLIDQFEKEIEEAKTYSSSPESFKRITDLIKDSQEIVENVDQDQTGQIGSF
jgi:serine/threonine protein kinase/tetratricopeptide (TPR) repeat protein